LKKPFLKQLSFLIFIFAISSLLLTVIQPPVGWSFLAWVAWVPFLVACSDRFGAGRVALAAYIVGVVYWLGNLHWVAPVTLAGWLAFCAYTALLWPALAMGIRFCRKKKVPLFLAAAVFIVGVERLQGLFLGGFLWRLLAHSQYENTRLIQIADIFGAGGVSFLIAMVNGLAAEIIVRQREHRLAKAWFFAEVAVVIAAVAGTLFYGNLRVKQSEEYVRPGPLVAAVQSNVPQSVKASYQASEQIFEDMMGSSQEAAATGAELIAWPETMVQAVLNPEVLKLVGLSHPYRVFDQRLRAHAKNDGYLLIGATGGVPRIEENLSITFRKKFNSVFLYRPDGSKAEETYSKIHLVPFGEYIPFKKSFPWLHDTLMKFSPYDYDYTLDPGTDYTVFRMQPGRRQPVLTEPGQTTEITPAKTPSAKETYRFGVMICYEDTVPAIPRRFALDEQHNKRVDWLVNVSNDGWFVRFEDNRIYPSAELEQHTATCVFRAVENRLSVLRSVNTGISCLIDSVGRIRDGYAAGSQGFPKDPTERTGLSGWFADEVSIDSRVTFFSLHGQWLDNVCGGAVIVVLPMGLLAKGFKGKGKGKKTDRKKRKRGRIL